ncbi:nitrate reductase [Maribrevibacterium harenarium]|uniref:nitrate reductase n=1 Tax=Maribrevibacterium harenarium TaxID=2589817 RepID=UPI0022A79374|nr:nitrate reductase [Maribrevibacterium harenarium]
MRNTTYKTTCPYCGVGCGVEVTQNDDHTSFSSVKGDKDHPANFGRLCVKGSSLAATLGREGRLLEPTIYGAKATWDEALTLIADKIRTTIENEGPGGLGFYLSGQMLTEDYYVANKLAKGFLGTANVDTNSRLCMASAVVAQKRAFGSDTVPCSYDDIDHAECIIMVGWNAAWTHPIVYQRIAAAKQRRPELKVIVIDPRKTATCDLADLHLAIKPGSDAHVFNYLLWQTERADKLDRDYINAHVNGVESALEAARISSSQCQTLLATGLSQAQLDQLVATWLSCEKTLTFYSQGVNQSSSGVDKGNAIINCHLVTGRIGKEGAGPFSITGQPNAMGGREVGGLANQLAAHMDFATPGAIETVQRFWQAPAMATENGLKAVDMFQAVEAGQIKVLWIMATNPLVSLPDSHQVRRALKKCELVIVSDCYAGTDTATLADVLLPATTWSEKDGTVTNSERCISRQRGILPPPGEVRHDWWAICEVAKRLGFQKAFSYEHPHEIFVEHAALSAFENNGQRDFNIGMMSQLTRQEYDQLSPIQWPVTQDQPYGTKRMFVDGKFFTPDQKARCLPILPKIPFISTSSDFPFVLNTGRVRDQWHTMTRTGRAPILNQHTDRPYVAISPADANALKIQEGQLLRLKSPVGQACLPAKITADQTPGNLFVPIHWNDQNTNHSVVSRLIPQVVDALSGQPESKHASVAIEPQKVAYYGTVLSGDSLRTDLFDHWCRVGSEGGERYEVALFDTVSLSSLCLQLVGVNGRGTGEWLEYTNPINGDQRFAYYEAGELRLVAYFSTTPDLNSKNWVMERIGQSIQEPLARMGVLAGSPVDVVDKGDVICSCFQTGSVSIQDAIEAGCDSVEALGEALSCGTNCGSCIPELKRFLTSVEAV